MRLNKHRTARVAVEENKKVDDLMKQMMQLPSVPKVLLECLVLLLLSFHVGYQS